MTQIKRMGRGEGGSHDHKHEWGMVSGCNAGKREVASAI